MAEHRKYILRTIAGNTFDRSVTGNRPIEQNLLNLSAAGIKWNQSLIKQIRTLNDKPEDTAGQLGSLNSSMFTDDDYFMKNHSMIAGQNDFIAFYDQSYLMRRDFLRKFALQGEITYVLETIADEVIVNDDMHYFAYPNTKQLRSILKADHGKEIVDDLNSAYRRVYHMFHFNESNNAWDYVRKFLIDGFLAFEIIYSDVRGKNMASNIIGFKELDPTKLIPQIKNMNDGTEYKVWIYNKGDKERERELPDTNVIYISWAKTNFISHLSYCEQLIRTFNTLRTIENSRVIWNLQNAQKRVKIVVPIGSESPQRQRTRLRELEAAYKEDIIIDNMSGEITVNGQPKFPFAKTFIFPSKEGTSTDISELEVAGHDLNSTEQLKWFWQRFIIETRLPKDRFNMLTDGQSTSVIPDNGTMTREEYKFSLFINRIRDIFKEILLKPTWIQFCLEHPEHAKNTIFKNALGLSFVEENVFALAKENANLKVSADIIQTLSQIQGPDGPEFSTRFLLQKYFNFTDEDWELNKKFKLEDMKKAQEGQQQEGGMPGGDMSGGFDSGMGGGDFGGGGETMGDLGGGDFGGGEEPMGGGEMPEASPEPVI